MNYKKTLVLVCSSLLTIAKAQFITETPEGDNIAFSAEPIEKTRALLSINTKDQNIQSRIFFVLPPSKNSNKNDQMFTFNIAGKAEDGVAPLYSDGNFNAGIKSGIGYSKIKLFDKQEINDNDRFTDFLNINVDYNYKKLVLINIDTTAKEQAVKQYFHGLAATIMYSALICKQHLFSFSTGYSRKNNYQSFDETRLDKTKARYDSVEKITGAETEVINGRKVKPGQYREFDRFPVRLAYTYCPTENKVFKNDLLVGGSLYGFSNIGRNIHNTWNLGVILFLTKADQNTGIRAPLIGIYFQVDDAFDAGGSDKIVQQRSSFGLTSTITLGN